MHLFGLQLAQLPRLQVENQRAVTDPPDLLDMVANLLEHLAQLAVAPLDHDHFVPGIVTLAHLADLRRSRAHPARANPSALFDYHA